MTPGNPTQIGSAWRGFHSIGVATRPADGTTVFWRRNRKDGAVAPAALYAAPRTVTDPADCIFYHLMEIPGHGFVGDQWDLRGREYQYLGGTSFRGKRVLEMGPASGFLTMYMERQGAEVVAYDLSEDFPWDIVPFAGVDLGKADEDRRQLIRRLNNGFWLTHAAHGSHARLVHGTVYDVPQAIGPVDIVIFGCILLHLRDPFLALQQALRLARETVVVTEPYPHDDRHLVEHLHSGPDPQGTETFPLTQVGEPKMVFFPQHWDHAYGETWWQITPAIVQRYLGVLGFEDTAVTYHFALGRGGTERTLLYTVRGRRTKEWSG
jgi:hypothetical protein